MSLTILTYVLTNTCLVHLDIPKEKKVRNYEKTNLKRKLRLIKAEFNNLVMFIVVLYNTIEHLRTTTNIDS